MPVISVRIDNEDDELIRTYSKANRITLSQFMRDAAIEKIEREVDLGIFNTLIKNTHNTYTIQDLQEELELYNV